MLDGATRTLCWAAFVAAAIAISAPPAVALRVDVTGDGIGDLISVRGARLLIRTPQGISTARVQGRLDGALRVDGVWGALLLVRAASFPSGVVDAVYRVHAGRVERLHVRGQLHDGLATALAGRTYLDVDCGASPRTVVQVEEEPIGHRWRETLLTFTLRGRQLTLTRVSRRIVAQARGRRCALIRH